MPEIRRGSLPAQLQVNSDPSISSATTATRVDAQSPLASPPRTSTVAFAEPTRQDSSNSQTYQQHAPPRASTDPDNADRGRRSLSYALRPEAEAYYDSRAGSHREWQRRAKTLDEYYDDNPHLLPQLPFTWHHGKKRWRLIAFAILIFIDASALPIILYYGMHYGGIEGWIIFAVVTTIWGGPTYFEFAMRTLRLLKKEKFYRPLGTDSRWSMDLLTWASVLTIFVVTALFVIGSAPHEVFLRVLCMPAPAILWCLGGVLGLLTLYNKMGWKAPFRISSTAKGEAVLPGIYYFIEDAVAVNAKVGRPFREALAARYKASPRFRQMLYKQSLFWCIPSLILAVPLTLIAVLPWVDPNISYGIDWAVPFVFMGVWGVLTIRMCKKDIARERYEWEASEGAPKLGGRPGKESSPVDAADGAEAV